MTNATSITVQRNSSITARVLASQNSKLPTQVAATRRPRDRKENSESVRSLALDLRVCGPWRAHVTSSGDVVSADPTHPRRRSLRTELLQTCPNSNAKALRSTKNASLPPNMHLPDEQASENIRSVYTDFKRATTYAYLQN